MMKTDGCFEILGKPSEEGMLIIISISASHRDHAIPRWKISSSVEVIYNNTISFFCTNSYSQ